MPVGRRLRPRERARLAIEILAAYRRARAALRRSSIEPAVETLRAGSLAATSSTEAAEAGNGRLTTGLQPGGQAASRSETLTEASRLGRAVQLTLRFAPGDTRCLTRSLVLTQLLARRRIPAKLVIGARTKPSFLAHAWVEHDGHPVLPPGESSFGRLVEL
jgi:hypothetical protein